MDSQNIIESSQLHENAKLGRLVTLINANIGDSCLVGNFSKMAYSIMGTMSYIGDYTVVINSNIGKFTSVSWGVTIGPEEHDYSKLTNHSFLYSLKSFNLTPYKHYSPFEKECVIGNDVWIGCNSTILRGVTVGHGAVVGANSLVNKDVPPYAIVVGSPAKIIKYRFSEAIISGLLESQWWDLSLDIIAENTELFGAEPTLEIIRRIAKIRL